MTDIRDIFNFWDITGVYHRADRSTQWPGATIGPLVPKSYLRRRRVP
jgi:hypothetical protein